jgi:DNA-binding CsgD family transcriptional regulator
LGEQLVGRRQELAAIDAFLAADADGAAALVVEGEAGIGKTSVWREGIERARGSDYRVLLARPVGAEVRLSLAGLGDLLGEVVDEALPGLPEPQRNALEVALLRSESRGSPDVRAVGVALAEVLRTLSRRAAVLIAVDDLQWLDRPSGELIAFALRRLDAEPVRLLASVRAEPGVGVPFELDRALGEERLRVLRLGPLSLGALYELVRTRLGLTLPRAALVRLHDASAGNPLSALEIGRELRRRGLEPTPDEPLPVPVDLRALLRDRLARLPERTRVLLVMAAALPRPTVGLLETAIGSSDEVEANLERALRAGVIELEGEQVWFSHPLLASVCYADASPRRRRRTHARLAELVDSPEARARHRALAAEGPDEEVALTLDEAARDAIVRGAPQAAAELWEMAAHATAGEQQAARRQRLKAAARSRYQSDDYVGARLLLEQLVHLTPKGAERADLLLSLAKTRMDDIAAAIHLSEQALDEAGGDQRLESLIHRELSSTTKLAGDVRGGLRHARLALDLADRTGDLELVVPALARVARLEIFTGEMTPGLLDRALALENHAEPGDPFYETPRAALFSWLMCKGRLDEGRELLQEELTKTAAEGHESNFANLILDLIPLECRAGNWARADELATELLEHEQRRGLEFQGSIGLYCRALVDAHLGRADESRAAAERGVAIAEAAGDEEIRILNVGVLGFVELSMGQFESAARHLRDLPARLTAQGWIEPTVHYPVWPDAIEALIALGELEQARDYLALFRQRAEAFESSWAYATGARCRGLLATAEGEFAEAREAFQRALAEHEPSPDEQSPEAFERGRTLLALGALERRCKQKRAARQALEAALQIFEELGARLWAERARGELARIGGRAPAADELTPAERRVAELVAEGRTNREAASILVVSVHTVDSHLRRVYRKLGVSSRAELAHRFAER